MRAYLILLRPELPFAAAVCTLLGQTVGLGDFPPLREGLLAMASVLLLAGSALVFNDIFDLEIDRINAPRRPLPSGLITIRQALLFGIAVSLAGLFMAALLGGKALGLALSVWLLGLAYNWHLKRAGIWGNLAVAFSVASIFVFGALTVGKAGEPLVWFLAILAGLIDMGEEIAGDVLDLEGDQAAGSRSLAVSLGIRSATAFSSVMFILAIVIGWIPIVLDWVPLRYGVALVIMNAGLLVGLWGFLRWQNGRRRLALRINYLAPLLGVIVLLVLRLLDNAPTIS